MHQDLEALLALQADDDVIDGLDGKLRALGPRLAELERRRKAVADHLAAAEASTQADEKKHRELALRKQRMKQYHARGLSPPENEAALERALEAERTACVAVQTGDEPIEHPANVPVQPIPAADEPVAQPAGEPAAQPADEQSSSD